MSLLTFGLILILSCFFAFKIANEKLAEQYSGFTLSILQFLVGLANGITIFVFSEIYLFCCYYINEKKNYKFQSNYDKSILIKSSFFGFVISYINLAYYSFFIGNIDTLAANFISIIFTKNLVIILKVKLQGIRYSLSFVLC